MDIKFLLTASPKSLKKRYGGVVKNSKWINKTLFLGTQPVILTISPSEVVDTSNNINIFWDNFSLDLHDQVFIPPNMNPIKVKWLINYLETIIPFIREQTDEIVKEHEISYVSDCNRKHA